MDTPSRARLLSILVENHPGVLQRVASMIRRRGFNIDSLSVGETDDPTVSRMTITVHVGKQQATQATKQVAKLIDVIEVDDITEDRVVAHEMLLVKLQAPIHKRRELLDIIDIYRGRVVDVAHHSLIAEVCGSEGKITNFIDLVRPFGIRELARSGTVALLRGDEVRLRLLDAQPGDGELAVQPTGTAGDMTGAV